MKRYYVLSAVHLSTGFDTILTFTFAIVAWEDPAWFCLYIGTSNWDGFLGCNGNEFDKLEYVVLALIGLARESLDTPPKGDDKGVPYESK